ncbi:MAG: hypothetical protein ACQKBT_08600 [Puniceicoccales bacterium]
MQITTPQGTLTFVDPKPQCLRSLQSALPLGMVAYSKEINGALYGIVMKCGDDEAWAIKQQPPEVPEESFPTVYRANSILIALSLHRFMKNGFGGCLIPCPYFRKKPTGVEAGIAYFGSPSTTGSEATKFPMNQAFDHRFGHGFTTMISRFVEALQASSKESGITLQQSLGLDSRPRSALDSLGMQFLIHGSELYCLKTQRSEQDPIWTAIRSTGIDRITYLPSLPAEIRPDQLAIAKPTRQEEDH